MRLIGFLAQSLTVELVNGWQGGEDFGLGPFSINVVEGCCHNYAVVVLDVDVEVEVELDVEVEVEVVVEVEVLVLEVVEVDVEVEVVDVVAKASSSFLQVAVTPLVAVWTCNRLVVVR